MAPARYRGAFSNGFQLCVGIGALAANLINYGTEKIHAGYGWRISLALAAVPTGILTLGALFLPDTPNSIIHRGGDPAAARRMLQRVRGAADVDAELADLISAAAPAGAASAILRRKYRPQLVMAVAIPFFQQVTGINVIAFYSPLLFITIGLGESAALMATIVTGAVVGTSFTFLSMLIVDRVGRRILFISGGVVMLASQLIVGAAMAAELGDRGGVGKPWGYLILTMISVYVAAFAWSWGPLGWLVPSEIFPLEIRSAGQSVTVAVNFLLTFVVAQMFLEMLCRMRSGIFFFFGGWVVVMTAFVYVFLPETKGVPMEKMEMVWKRHWFWKRFFADDEEDNIYVGNIEYS